MPVFCKFTPPAERGGVWNLHWHSGEVSKIEVRTLIEVWGKANRLINEVEITNLTDMEVVLLYGPDPWWYQEPITGRRIVRL